jgi:geranylgeranyl pyrophosphate synthase
VDRILIRAQTFTPAQLEQLIGLLTQSGGIDYTRDCAAAHMQLAREALTDFDPCAARDVLLDIVDYAWARTT